MFGLFTPETHEYRVQYLCSFRPVWYDATPNAQPHRTLHEARQEADAICRMRRGHPVQVLDEAGQVVYSNAYVIPR